MLTYLLITLASIVILGIIVIIFLQIQAIGANKKSSAVELIKTDMTELSRSIGEMQKNIGDRFDRSQDSVQKSVSAQLTQSSRLVADVTQRLAKLDETNRRVVDVAEELRTLQHVLSSPKQRGGFGEYYLETVLANVLPPHVYEMQYRFSDGEIVDAVIHLDKERIIPIDSKFSLENYNRLLDEKDKTQRELLSKTFKADLKKRIDETSKYIRPNENTLDYAFMFIPSEAIYYDLLVSNVGSTGTNSRDLIEYAFIDKKVIIVSPTTLLAYLQTVMQGLKSLQIETEAKEIQKRVGELGKHIAAHEQYMQKLGTTLGTTVSHYNNAHKSLGRMDRDVLKIAKSGDTAVEPLLLSRPTDDDDK